MSINTKAQKKGMSTETLVLSALMTALVIVFQCLATYTTFFGPFSTAIGLIPIVIGAVLCGPIIGAWLGLVFGIVVMITGGANLFFAFSIIGTLITVILKGVGCGFAAGYVNKLLAKFNKTVAVVASAIVCPVVNTGIFLLGCVVFFMPYADAIAEVLALNVSGLQVFSALAFGNFLFELGMNIVLSPVILKIIEVAEKTFNTKKTGKKAQTESEIPESQKAVSVNESTDGNDSNGNSAE
ncbi:MAG: ECF transporter S component [Clostridia bacterium]|nr:ECF transporter S component [Clostridia bacterium]